MTSAAIDAQGTTIGRGDGGGSEVFTTIPEIATINGPSGSAAVLDVTSLSSTAKEKRMGLPDEGQITLSGFFVPTNAQHTGLRTDRNAQTLRNFVITFSEASTASFAAYVTNFSTSVGVDDTTKLDVTLEISGAVTWA